MVWARVVGGRARAGKVIGREMGKDSVGIGKRLGRVGLGFGRIGSGLGGCDWR